MTQKSSLVFICDVKFYGVILTLAISAVNLPNLGFIVYVCCRYADS
jgi:hypothetical protein